MGLSLRPDGSRSSPHSFLIGATSLQDSSAAAEPRPTDMPAASDLPAVAEIYAEFGTFVWRNLRRLGIPESHIEDAVQDVFLVIHRRLPEFEARSSLRTWIFGIVMRVAAREREHLRNRAQRFAPVPSDTLEALAQPTGKDPFDRLVQQRAADLIELVLGELEEDKRNMLVMVELEEMPVVEVAQVLEINVNSAYTRLRLARRELEARLKRLLGGSKGAV